MAIQNVNTGEREWGDRPTGGYPFEIGWTNWVVKHWIRPREARPDREHTGGKERPFRNTCRPSPSVSPSMLWIHPFYAANQSHLPPSAENGGRGGNRRKDIRWLNALNEREQRKSWKEGREDAGSTDKASPRLPPIPSSLNGYTTGCSARAGAGGRKDVAADRSGLCCN